MASFETLFPFLTPGGIYIIEDWAWGHWPEYVKPDHKWANEEPLTSLVIKLIEATGTSFLRINCITILQGFVAVERSKDIIIDPAHFSLEDYIVRRPAKSIMKPPDVVFSVNNSPSPLLVNYRRWAERAFPPRTSRQQIYERIKKSLHVLLRI